MTRLVIGLIISFTCVVNLHAAPRAKVLFVGKEPDHPFGSHMYLHTHEMLSKCLALNGELETVISSGWPTERSALEGVSTVVVYSSPAAEFLLDSPNRDQVVELLDRGVGLVTIHWASSVYEKNFERIGPKWMSYLGGTWISNVGLHTGESRLRQLAPDHPAECRRRHAGTRSDGQGETGGGWLGLRAAKRRASVWHDAGALLSQFPTRALPSDDC